MGGFGLWNPALDAKLQEVLKQSPAATTNDRWEKNASIIKSMNATQNKVRVQAVERSKAAKEKRQIYEDTDEDVLAQLDLALETILEQAAALGALHEKVVKGAQLADIYHDLYTVLAPTQKAESSDWKDFDVLDVASDKRDDVVNNLSKIRPSVGVVPEMMHVRGMYNDVTEKLETREIDRTANLVHSSMMASNTCKKMLKNARDVLSRGQSGAIKRSDGYDDVDKEVTTIDIVGPYSPMLVQASSSSTRGKLQPINTLIDLRKEGMMAKCQLADALENFKDTRATLEKQAVFTDAWQGRFNEIASFVKAAGLSARFFLAEFDKAQVQAIRHRSILGKKRTRYEGSAYQALPT